MKTLNRVMVNSGIAKESAGDQALSSKASAWLMRLKFLRATCHAPGPEPFTSEVKSSTAIALEAWAQSEVWRAPRITSIARS